ncbi:MAG: hypothetical protein DHS20C02_00850 [Micavibrio sp.]|nr:MAG: hypothetical protein DHS20C02_00850 [Micavibrio sp.]
MGNVSDKYKDQPAITITTDPVDLEFGAVDRAISYRHILDTGKIPQNIEGSQFDQSRGTDTWDPHADDAFNRALKTIEEKVLQEIESSPEMQGLLSKETWGKEDRVSWESFVAESVTKHTQSVPGLDEYREFNGQKTVHLNDLSKDIEYNSDKNLHGHGFEFNCRIMTLTKGIVLQRIEDHQDPDGSYLLPRQSSGPGDYKAATDYRYMEGDVAFGPPSRESQSGHGYIMSPETGSIIESTGDKDVYQKNYSLNGGGFETALKGIPIITESLVPDEYYVYSSGDTIVLDPEYVAAQMEGALAFAESTSGKMLVSLETNGVRDIAQTRGHWESAFKRLGELDNHPDIAAAVQESFYQNFIVPLEKADLKNADMSDKGDFKQKTLEWAQEQMHKLEEIIEPQSDKEMAKSNQTKIAHEINPEEMAMILPGGNDVAAQPDAMVLTHKGVMDAVDININERPELVETVYHWQTDDPSIIPLQEKMAVMGFVQETYEQTYTAEAGPLPMENMQAGLQTMENTNFTDAQNVMIAELNVASGVENSPELVAQLQDFREKADAIQQAENILRTGGAETHEMVLTSSDGIKIG